MQITPESWFSLCSVNAGSEPITQPRRALSPVFHSHDQRPRLSTTGPVHIRRVNGAFIVVADAYSSEECVKDMASLEETQPQDRITAPPPAHTMTGAPPAGSNAAPNSQTPGHPSFRR